MKHPLLMAGLAACLLLSCSKKEKDLQESTPKPEEKITEIPSSLKEALTCLKFDTQGAKMQGDYLILENDIIISKKNLQDKIEAMAKADTSARTSQYALNPDAVLTWANSGGITYFIDPSVNSIPGFGAQWVTAILEGTTDWNNIPSCHVQFTRVMQAAGAELIFYADGSPLLPGCGQNLGGNVVARSRYPEGGNIGAWISINDNISAFFDYNGMVSTIRHEVGHALGFRHSDMYNRIDGGGNEGANSTTTCGQQVFGGNLLLATPDRDLNSVMVSASDGFTNTPFNNFDIRAAQLLYPDDCCAPALSGWAQDVGIGGLKEIRYYLNNIPIGWDAARIQMFDGAGSLMRTWLINGDQTEYGTLPNARHGTFTLRARGVNYRRDFEGTQTSEFTVTF